MKKREGRLRGVLVDVEGTTTPISFVYDVLFPFAAAQLEGTCASPSEEVAAAVLELGREHAKEAAAGGSSGLPELGDGAPYARFLMSSDRKSTGLKRLQGLIWREGYARGDLHGEVFGDVPAALARWQNAGLRLRVFSSGSVLAQKLLFSTTPQGELTKFFEGFHDTTTGPKNESGSYRAIADAFALPPAEILFLSDVLAELDAAAGAGMATGLLRRPGNKPVDRHGHPEYADFDAVDAALELG